MPADPRAAGTASAGKALIAMSGGVDSSAAAVLVQESGFSCVGCTMILHGSAKAGDQEDASGVCEKLGIPYRRLECADEFREKVILPFIGSYEKGETPNPCILCNKSMKFGRLFDLADELGCSHVATGHYARIEEREGHFWLMKAADPEKDQSYVLYGLTEKQLARTLFPLGGSSKPAVREIAKAHGFVNADKKESQDICFVPDGDYAAVIRQYTDRDYPAGDIVDTAGNVLGRHDGLIHYTVGQRRGLGIASDRRLYVKELDTVRNRVILADNEELFVRRTVLRDFHWITGDLPASAADGIRCSVKVRYRHREQPAVVIPGFDGHAGTADGASQGGAGTAEGGHAVVLFDEPVRAVTPGQSAVFYDGDTVLGGGIIDRVSSR